MATKLLAKKTAKKEKVPEYFLKPSYNTLITKPLTEEHISAGGIIIPETVDAQDGEDVRCGYLVKAGPSTDPKTPFLYEEGDLLTYGEYAGRRVTLNGEEYHILRHLDVLCSSSHIL